MRRVVGGLVLALVAGAAPLVSSQSAQLTVIEAGPTGEIQQLDQANEIQVLFSEPMVVLGRVPSNPAPEWIHIVPAIKGSYRWSGTTLLVFTPDPGATLPRATRYMVTVDAAATSAAGRRLGSVYQFAFTTPTVRLQSARWARQSSRFDSPVAIALRFNQPVRSDDVLAHLSARFQTHQWAPPTFTAAERSRLATTEPAGLRQFDDKVAVARQVAAASGSAGGLRVATTWDQKRFPPADTLVVLETVNVPPPGSWVLLTLDARMPSPEGSALPGQPQTSTIELDPPFFVIGPRCQTECAPSSYNGIRFTARVATDRFARALAIRDVTTPAREQPVAQKSTPKSGGANDFGPGLSSEDAGFDRQPALSTWAYRLDPSLASDDGQVLGYPWVGLVETWHDRALTSFGDGHGVWEKSSGPQLPFSARNFSDVTQWLASIGPSQLVPRIVALQKKNFAEVPPPGGTTRRLGGAADAILAHGLDLSKVLSPGGTGLVWAMIAPGQPIPKSTAVDHVARSTVVQVTNLGITVKDSPRSTLVFVTRLDSGEAVAGARVSLINLANKVLWRGTTDRDGVALAPALALRKAGYGGEGEGDDGGRFESSGPFSYVCTAEKDGDVAYVASDWQEGIEPWAFGVDYDLWQNTDILRGSVFTDRGVYRPGEDVHLKAIVRADTPTGMRLLPGGATLDIRVHDSRDREVDRRSVKVNRWSGADWTWTVPADGSVGQYRIAAWVHDAEPIDKGNDAKPRPVPKGEWLKHVDGGFLVAAYRRPDFRVGSTLTTTEAIAGSPMHASVDGRYLFGNAMARRSVRWRLDREPTFGVPEAVRKREEWKDFQFGYYRDIPRPQNTRIAGETTTLDANGKLAIDLTTARDADYPYQYTFQGEVEDVSRQRIAQSAGLVIYPASFFVGLHLGGYFAEIDKGAHLDVVAAGHDGQPVSGVAVTVSATRVNWNSVRRAEGSGFYTWETEKISTPAGEWTVRTTASPVSLTIPLSEGGYYEVKAVARDAEGRPTRTDVSFYGLGKGYTAWERYDHNRITLKPERNSWKPGDTARVMIQSPWETATALLTVEREGIRHYERFALTSTQQTVSVPIAESDIPNVYVSVLLIRGRTSQEPGPDGSDPGQPSFRVGYTELVVEDASKKLGVKVSADRSDYRPAATARVSVDVADAAGKPTKSDVTLWAVDYGVLSLTGYEAPDVLQSIYRAKALQVATVDNRQRIVSRRVLTPKGASDGGGGGAESGAGALRKDFRPLAFWLGSIETAGNGHATTDVKLPDSLTTYRIMAVAGDQLSRFGAAPPAEIVVNKPLALLPAFPRFLSLGDRATFGGSITNTLTASGSVVVTIRSLDPAVLSFESGRQTITLGPGTTEAVRFDATTRSTGTARVQMTATLGDQSDAFETTLPVSVIAPIETQAAFGEVTDRSTERIATPPNVIPQLGGLQIDLASTALVGLGEGVRYLNEYPYGCAEQKASRALVLLLASDLGQAFSMGRITPAEYRRQATTLLKDLPNYQCPSGGFTFWPGSCSLTNAYLTAYVLHVMDVAGTLGVAPDSKVVTAALDYLERALKDEPPRQVQYLPMWGASMAFAAKVLAEHGRNQDANITRLVGISNRLPMFGLSYLADALASAGDRGPRYQDVIRRLTNGLRLEGDQAHAEEGDQDTLMWLWDSNASATAIVLDGFVRRGDDPVFVQRMVRWLLAARQNGRWSNTHENARALQSLVAYYRKFEAETPSFDATVTLGLKTVGKAAFRGRTTVAQTVRIAMSDLVATASAPTDLVFSRAGTGHLFYTTRLRFVTSDPPPAADRGIHVERRYETFVENGDGPAGTSFAAGDLIRVTLVVTVPKERRFVAVTDPLPAGVEPVDGWFRTTAADIAKQAERNGDRSNPFEWWRNGGFDRTEKYDDRVQLFATRLGEGRHEFSYLVRATTAGSFKAAGTWAEEMYSPDVNGRSAAVVLSIR